MNSEFRILIVEDSVIQAEMLRRLLLKEGYTVDVAYNGVEGLSKAREFNPSLIISDIIMPEMDGYEMCKKIKDIKEIKDIPIVLLTQLTEPEEVIRGLESGANSYFTKPFDEEYLLEEVRSMLEKPDRYRNRPDKKCIEFEYRGKHYEISSGRVQTLSYLMSTYENAVRKSRALYMAQECLRKFNEELDAKIREKTKELRESEERYKSLVESITDYIYTVKVENGRAVSTTHGPGCVAVTGYTSEEYQMEPNLWYEMIHDEDRKAVLEQAEEILSGKAVNPLEHRIIHKDNSIRWVRNTPVPHYDKDGRLDSYDGMIEDITERKKAEEALKASEEKFRTLVENIPQKIFVKDRHSVYISCNDNYARDLKIAPDEIAGRTDYEFYPRELAEKYRADDKAVMNERITKEIEEEYIQDGEKRFVNTIKTPIRDKEGKVVAVLGIFWDITERKKLEERTKRMYEELQNTYNELRQTQQIALQQERLNALGQMASGIAHDINNALSPIVGYTELLLMEHGVDNRVRDYLKMIQTAGGDIARIVARLREFYRKREETAEMFPLEMNNIVKQIIDLTRPRWKDITQEHGIVIDIKMELHPELPIIIGLESEIREALTNLIFNSIDAMPHGGTIVIRTYAMDEIKIAVEVSDTGIGMDEETKRRCLEPFFSTKGERGTGMGLSMVYGVMQRHSGDIQIESEPGKGTTVRLIFPVREMFVKKAEEPVERHEYITPLNILYIDDEPLLRRLMKDMLQRDGHTVEVADGGQAGIDAFHTAKEKGKPFDVVITDLGMPKMDGREVARTVKAESPETPVFMLTGWGKRMDAEGRIPPEVDRVLDKPPHIGELRKALKEIIKAE